MREAAARGQALRGPGQDGRSADCKHCAWQVHHRLLEVSKCHGVKAAWLGLLFSFLLE